MLLDYHHYWRLRSLPQQPRHSYDTDVEMVFRPTHSPIPEDADEGSSLSELSSSDREAPPPANAPPIASLPTHAESFDDEALANNRRRRQPSTPEHRKQRQIASARKLLPMSCVAAPIMTHSPHSHSLQTGSGAIKPFGHYARPSDTGEVSASPSSRQVHH